VYSRTDYLRDRIPKIWRQYIQCIVKVVRTTRRFNTKTKYWEKTTEDSYYLSTEIYSAKDFDKYIRGHWKIENSDHYVRDYSMQEDHSRIRVNPDNFSILRSFALNILRANKKTNIKSELYKNSLSLIRLMKFNFLS
jgi:predicted transposase YbfD/YdcC